MPGDSFQHQAGIGVGDVKRGPAFAAMEHFRDRSQIQSPLGASAAVAAHAVGGDNRPDVVPRLPSPRADLVLFSGDKLLGGPQCGIMAGTALSVGLVESDPLMRALRLDKMTLAALEATLLLACDRDRAVGRIPLWSMLATPVDALLERATKLASIFRSELGLNAAAVSAEAYLGGGSAPVQSIPSAAVAVSPPFPTGRDSESELARALRQGHSFVVTRVQKGHSSFST